MKKYTILLFALTVLLNIQAQDYHLYRLFNLNEDAKMFIKKGDLGSICHAVPITFQGCF